MMATKATFDFTIVPNKAAKSSVWAHFGFVKRNGELDKKKVACRLCYSEFKYSGNTTNLTDHLKRKHPTFAKHAAATPSEVKFKSLTSPYHPATALHTSKSEATESTQQPQPGSFHSIFGTTKLPVTSRRAKEITGAMAQFIVKDLRPYSVVQNSGFKNLIRVLEPKYTIPSRQHFSETVIPELYAKISQEVKQQLNGNYVALTTDGWTSRATESYVTVTSSHIDENWNIKNYVLQVKLSICPPVNKSI